MDSQPELSAYHSFCIFTGTDAFLKGYCDCLGVHVYLCQSVYY